MYILNIVHDVYEIQQATWQKFLTNLGRGRAILPCNCWHKYMSILSYQSVQPSQNNTSCHAPIKVSTACINFTHHFVFPRAGSVLQSNFVLAHTSITQGYTSLDDTTLMSTQSIIFHQTTNSQYQRTK